MGSVSGNDFEAVVSTTVRKPLREIEHSLTKKYRKYLWAKFNKAVREFELIEEGDKVAVAISGGKDSLLMAKLFQEMQKHKVSNFELEFIAMDPGFLDENREILLSNCEYLNIPVKIFKTDIFEVVDNIANDYPCYMCARMRRGALYSKAQELGCNKLALGHHFDDVIETTLLNIFYSGSFKTMLPKLKSQHFDAMELIRPMYYIREENIKRFMSDNGIECMNCGCIVSVEKTSSKRQEVKELIKELNKKIDGFDNAIFSSTQNVNMDCILRWKKNGVKYSFLDFYDDVLDDKLDIN